MAIAAWKRLEKSPGYQRKKLFFKRLVGKELRLRPDLRIHAVKDGGWWFHPDVLDDRSIVYSLGVGEDVDFDLALVRRFGCELHAFDPTPSTVDWIAGRELPPAVQFHPWAVTAHDGTLTLYPRIRRDGSRDAVMYTMVPGDGAVDDRIEVPAMSLGSIAKRLGHERLDLLKMDIEGAEYEVLDSLLESAVKPVQLLVEFHHRFPGIGPGRTADMIERLRAAGYRLFAIAETGRELSFILPGSLEQHV
jgi:FkbM family methyltransferase